MLEEKWLGAGNLVMGWMRKITEMIARKADVDFISRKRALAK
ncbi:hypothetical protein [Paenibacillus xylanexedens]|nr:hypothetical protein [Paenibacillus xylanexedens]